mmetsp:Transcript_16352/g.38409  ORF Transcript_16352/g.38409 Transcript_16352/m.38409 type:complete len:322 (+) Transcript_16352:275-1240(+)
MEQEKLQFLLQWQQEAAKQDVPAATNRSFGDEPDQFPGVPGAVPDEKRRIRELEEALEKQLEETRTLKKRLSAVGGQLSGESVSPRAARGPEGGEASFGSHTRSHGPSLPSAYEPSSQGTMAQHGSGRRASGQGVLALTLEDDPSAEGSKRGGGGSSFHKGKIAPSDGLSRAESRESERPPRFSQSSARAVADLRPGTGSKRTLQEITAAHMGDKAIDPETGVGGPPRRLAGLGDLGAVVQKATAAQKAVVRMKQNIRKANAEAEEAKVLEVTEMEEARRMVSTGGSDKLTPLQIAIRVVIFLCMAGALGYGCFELFRRLG